MTKQWFLGFKGEKIDRSQALFLKTNIFMKKYDKSETIVDLSKEFLLERNINISAQAEIYEFIVRCIVTNLIFK